MASFAAGRRPQQLRLKPVKEAASSSSGPLTTKVHFRVAYEQVNLGESVRVVGNHPLIGDWVPENGLKLTTTEDIFPCWISCEQIVFESNFQVQYKYVVVGEDGQLRAWEDYTGNRTFLTSGAEMAVEDDEGQYRQFVANGEDDDEEEDADLVEPVLTIKTPEMRKLMFDHKMSMVNDLEGSFKIGIHDTVFMVALSLPIKLIRGEGGSWQLDNKAPSDGRNFAWLPLVREFRERTKKRVVCVGWPGVHVDSFREKAEIERLLAKHDYIPVFPPQQDFDKYVSFCTTFLWPVFHDVMMFFQTSKPLAFDEQGWAAYQYINNLYANAVVPHTHETDLIWIHDYHLLMTSTFISRKLVKANIGFYLHTPFPSSDSFKSLPIREELLSGMLCTDQIGFQFFAYARNFLISVKRVCGHDPSFKAGGFFGLECNGRHIMIRVAHFVYPYLDTKQVVLATPVQRQAVQVRSLFKDKIIFVSMDRCDNLSGLVPKFRAFKRFLYQNQQYKGKAVLVQYTFESASGYDSTDCLLSTLKDKADGLLEVASDGDLAITPMEGGTDASNGDIFLRIEKVSRDDRLALFRAGDVLLDTSVKAGLNLMPFEFISAHHDEEEHPLGVMPSAVIISEFSGCSRVLLGSIRVNPWNTADLVSACKRAIEMDPTEKKEFHICNLQYVSGSSPFEWFKDFLEDLRRNRKKEGMRFEAVGFGAKIRHIAMTQNFQKLPTESVMAAYRNAKNRVLLFDNEGTLASDTRNLFREYGAPKGDVSDLKSHGSAPDERVLECLRTLCQDQRNTVVILSGRDQNMLDQWFGSVPRLGLAAERGFYYRLPMTGNTWHCMQTNPDYTWQSYAFEIMRQYVKRTQGSFIESKGSALVWQYRDADQHFGSWQAKELSTNLKDLLFGFDVEIVNGKGHVEVKLRGVNKGVACTRVLAKVTQLFGEVDFVLCIGDDRSDEAMFEALTAYFGNDEEGNDSTSSQVSTTDETSEGARSEIDAAARGVATGSSPLSSPSTSDPTIPRTSDTLGSLGLAKGRTGGRGGGFGGAGTLSSLGSLNNMGAMGAGGPLGGGDRSLARLGSGNLSFGGSGGLGGSGVLEDLSGGGGGGHQKVFSCTVGRKPSAAKFYLDDVDEVSELLGSLKSQHDRRSKEVPQSYHTWSGGDMRKGMRVGSMPALSSLAYGAPTARPKP